MHRQDSKGKYRVRTVRSALQITQTDIQKYLNSRDCKRTKGTIEEYRHSLRLLYKYLPNNKQIGPHTLEQWRSALLEKGYGYRTINSHWSYYAVMEATNAHDFTKDNGVETWNGLSD